MSRYLDQVAAALGALSVRSPSAYSWLGQVFERRGGRPAPAAEPTARPWIAERLHPRLYADFYLTGGPAPASAPVAWRLDLTGGARPEPLSDANRGGGSIEAGWVWHRRDGDRIVVRRDGLEVWARPEELASQAGVEPSPGAEVGLRLPKERLGLSGGFYTVLGDAGTGAGAPRIDRVYWHLHPAGAPLLTATASEVLNREGLVFRLKVANGRRGFRRCDTGVLYTRREDRDRMLALVGEIRRRTAAEMREAVPALTLPLAPGLAFAEDPGGGESYGSHRCRLIVEAVLEAWREGENTLEGRLARVAEAFRRKGLDIARPYLGPDATGDPAGGESVV